VTNNKNYQTTIGKYSKVKCPVLVEHGLKNFSATDYVITLHIKCTYFCHYIITGSTLHCDSKTAHNLAKF